MQTKIRHILCEWSVGMVDYETAVQHLQQQKLALQYVVGPVRIL